MSGARRTKAGHAELCEKLVIASLVCDGVIIFYSLALSYWLRFMTALRGIGVTDDGATFGGYVSYFILGTVSLVMFLGWMQVYDKRALLRGRSVGIKIVKACFFWALGLLALSLMLKLEPPISRIYVLIVGLAVPFNLLVWRRLFHRSLRNSAVLDRLRTRVILLGWNEHAAELVHAFEHDPAVAFETIGCVEPRLGWSETGGPEEIPVLGCVDDLHDLFGRHEVDCLIVADIDSSRSHMVELANLCEREMVQFKIIPSYFQILVSGLHSETLAGVPILGVSSLPLDRFPRVFLKRIIDIIGSVIGLILTAPIIALFGFLVYRESPGPILYRQRRLGKDGALFDILKIRSMRLDAEADGKVGWSTEIDPRRLRVGSLMRKYNIDELPQFWNVLKGEMSLVGPRPERPELIADFKMDIPHYNARHGVKPGITGWAQVNGFRGDTDLTERIRCDLYYLENWSIFLDAQIIAMTLVSNKNAA